MKELTPTDIQSLISKYIKQILDADEHDRDMDASPFDSGCNEDHIKILGMIRELSKNRLMTKSYDWISETLDAFLKEENIVVDKESPAYRKLCREMLKANDHIFQVQQKREQGDYSDEFIYTAPTPVQQESSGLMLKDLINEYITDRIDGNVWAKRTRTSYQGHLRVIAQILDDNYTIDSFSHPEVRSLKDTLRLLPSGMNKKKVFKNKTVSEILELNKIHQYPTLTVKTVNNYVETLSGFFRFCRDQGYMDTNFAQGKKIKTKRRHPQDQRDIFTTNDLNTIFNAPEYMTFDKPYKFWLPILGLYTGARLNEICQLKLEDIKEIEGMLCFDIHGDRRSV